MDREGIKSRSLRCFLTLFFIVNLFSREANCDHVLVPVRFGENANISAVSWTVALREPNGIGSGTVIGNRWVLTAAHVTDNMDGEGAFVIAGIGNTNEVDLTNATQNNPHHEHMYTVEQIILHPEYNPQTGAHDIALVRVNRNLPTAIPFLRGTNNEINVGAEVRFAGFGIDENEVHGILRIGNNHIDEVNNDDHTFTIFYDADPNAENPGSPTIPYEGDSGGAVWIERNGQPFLVGINVRAVVDGECAMAQMLNIEYYADWIQRETDIEPFAPPNIMNVRNPADVVLAETARVVTTIAIAQLLLRVENRQIEINEVANIQNNEDIQPLINNHRAQQLDRNPGFRNRRARRLRAHREPDETLDGCGGCRCSIQ